MTREAVELGAVAARIARIGGVCRHADGAKPVDPPAGDLGHAGHRLDVVDDRRLAEEAFDCREGGLDPGPGPLPLQAFNEPCLLAADVSRSSLVQVEVEREGAPLDGATEVAGGIGLVDRPLQPLPALRIFVAQIEVGSRGPRGIRRQDNSLNHLMGIVFHQDAVVECARLALVGIDAEVNRPGVVFGQERPLEASGKPGAAPAAEARRFDHLHDVDRLLFPEDLLEGRVATAGAVAGQGVAVGNADGFQQNGSEWWHGMSAGGAENWRRLERREQVPTQGRAVRF